MKTVLALITIFCIFYIGSVIHARNTPPHVTGTYDGCADCSQLAKDLAQSLDAKKSDWYSDGYTICKSNGLFSRDNCIWVSNGEEYLTIGRNFLGSGWMPKNQDANLIWRAVERWQMHDASNPF